ncbi:hypothetical protein F2P81_004755 [Scophthalmus maximus]|uniref:Uncharacterized protein n=1 Tax=Scophthalmus maximus TaxID=52904 RepID=A0A6A4TG48_SCOMX|nr:hypothetical protein F2P81_004755 [Scophthalmus maximus]
MLFADRTKHFVPSTVMPWAKCLNSRDLRWINSKERVVKRVSVPSDTWRKHLLRRRAVRRKLHVAVDSPYNLQQNICYDFGESCTSPFPRPMRYFSTTALTECMDVFKLAHTMAAVYAKTSPFPGFTSLGMCILAINTEEEAAIRWDKDTEQLTPPTARAHQGYTKQVKMKAQVRRRTHLPSQGFESEKCVYSFLFLKVSQVERVPGAAALHLNTGAH